MTTVKLTPFKCTIECLPCVKSISPNGDAIFELDTYRELTTAPLILMAGVYFGVRTPDKSDYETCIIWAGKRYTGVEVYNLGELNMGPRLFFGLVPDSEILQHEYNDSKHHREVLIRYFSEKPGSNEECEKAFYEYAKHAGGPVAYGYIFSAGQPKLVTTFIDKLVNNMHDYITEDCGTMYRVDNCELPAAYRDKCYRGFAMFRNCGFTIHIGMTDVFKIAREAMHCRRPPSILGAQPPEEYRGGCKKSFTACVVKGLWF